MVEEHKIPKRARKIIEKVDSPEGWEWSFEERVGGWELFFSYKPEVFGETNHFISVTWESIPKVYSLLGTSAFLDMYGEVGTGMNEYSREEVIDILQKYPFKKIEERAEESRIKEEVKNVKGVGDVIAGRIAKKFETLKELESASVSDLVRIRGVTKRIAKEILGETEPVPWIHEEFEE